MLPRLFGVALAVTLTLAACGKKSPTDPSPPPGCTFTVSRASFDFTAGGGTESVAVSTATGCTWSASSDRDWVTIAGGSAGNGNGTVSIAATANTSGAARFGTFTIAGQQLPVRQEGVVCEVTIAPLSESYSDKEGSGTIAVTAPDGCEWIAASTVAWVSINSGSSGAGSGSVGFS